MSEQVIQAVEGHNLNPGIIDAHRFQCAGVSFCNRDGIGAVPDVANVAYKGAIVLMRPSAFLSVTPDLNGYSRTVKYLGQLDGHAIGTPFLDIDIDEEAKIAKVKGHEGRSRMTFLKDAIDDTPVPVAIFLSMDRAPLRARHIEPWMLDMIHDALWSERTEDTPSVPVQGPIFTDAVYKNKRDQIVTFNEVREFDTPKL